MLTSGSCWSDSWWQRNISCFGECLQPSYWLRSTFIQAAYGQPTWIVTKNIGCKVGATSGDSKVELIVRFMIKSCLSVTLVLPKNQVGLLMNDYPLLLHWSANNLFFIINVTPQSITHRPVRQDSSHYKDATKITNPAHGLPVPPK